METDIDTVLGRIGRSDSHPGLHGLEDRVLTVIADQPARAMARCTTFAAASFALLFGLGSVVFPAPEATAKPLVPFGVPSPLAPSSLLLDAR